MLRNTILAALAASSLFLGLAYGQDDAGSSDIDLDALMKEIDLGSGSAAQEVSYEGQISGTAPNFKTGTALAITHTGGTIAVRCVDQPGVTARLSYVVYGTQEAAMERFGKAIGIAAWGDANGGGVKTRIPGKTSGVNRADIPLTVNAPKSAKITITGGNGWVQVIDCEGTVKSTNSAGGAFVSGTYSSVNVNGGGGDVKVELTDASKLVGANSVTANGGDAVLRLPLTYGGKFAAKGASVSVLHTVAGTNSDTLVSGTIGTGTTSLNISAKGSVSVTAPQ